MTDIHNKTDGGRGQKGGFVITILKGVGQIMLQENAATGLLFLIGIFYGSLTMGLAAILAVCCGTLTAMVLGYDRTEIEQGMYGFSAALVGVALFLYFKPVPIGWALVIVGSAVATIVQHWFIKQRIPVFTFPFVLVTWAILFASHHSFPEIMAVPGAVGDSEGYSVTFPLRGFGQVIFQDSILAGSLFFIAILINSPAAALYAIAAAVMAGMLSSLLGMPEVEVRMGLFSYNAVLCAIVFAGSKLKDSFWVLIAVVLSVLISILMFRYQLTQLTFPFVAAACITLAIKNASGKFADTAK